jgi:hypothetical protein
MFYFFKNLIEALYLFFLINFIDFYVLSLKLLINKINKNDYIF